MTVHDLVIANASGSAVRTDLNNALAAIGSNSSNSSAITGANSYPYQWQVRTDVNKLYMRDASTNTTWHEVGDVGVANLGLAKTASPTFTGVVGIANGNGGTPSLTFASDTDTGLYRSGSNVLGISASGTASHLFKSTGSEPQVPLKATNGSNSAPSLTFASDTDLGLYRSAADTLSITTGGTERVSFDSTGLNIKSQFDLRLYDSNSSNYAAIQAPSNIGTNYTLTLPADDGADGEVLTTDGSGVCDWGYPAKLETARTINGVSFDGSANITVPPGIAGSTKAGQVVSTTKTSATTGTTAGGVVNAISGFSVSITPTSASSKVLLIATITGASTTRYTEWFFSKGGTRISAFKGDAASNRNRSSTTLGIVNYGGHEEWANSPIVVYNTTIMYLDSPSTTSATTYAVGVENFHSSSDTWSVNRSIQDTDASYGARTVSTITAIEVL